MNNLDVALIVVTMAKAFHIHGLERTNNVYDLYCNKQYIDKRVWSSALEWYVLPANKEGWSSVFKTIEMDEKVEAWRLEKERMYDPAIENQQELF